MNFNTSENKLWHKIEMLCAGLNYLERPPEEIMSYENRKGLMQPKTSSAGVRRRLKDSSRQTVFHKYFENIECVLYTTFDENAQKFTERNTLRFVVRNTQKPHHPAMFIYSFRKDAWGEFVDNVSTILKTLDILFSEKVRPKDSLGQPMYIMEDGTNCYKWQSQNRSDETKAITERPVDFSNMSLWSDFRRLMKKKEYYTKVRKKVLIAKGLHKGGSLRDIIVSWRLTKAL